MRHGGGRTAAMPVSGRPPHGARPAFPYAPNTTVRFGRSSTCSENTSGRA